MGLGTRTWDEGAGLGPTLSGTGSLLSPKRLPVSEQETTLHQPSLQADHPPMYHTLVRVHTPPNSLGITQHPLGSARHSAGRVGTDTDILSPQSPQDGQTQDWLTGNNQGSVRGLKRVVGTEFRNRSSQSKLQGTRGAWKLACRPSTVHLGRREEMSLEEWEKDERCEKQSGVDVCGGQ